jgi:hypothetical protein
MPEWKKNAYGYPVFRAGNEYKPINPAAEPVVGDRVRLEFENCSFDVEIENAEENRYIGRVHSIGPEPILEAHGVRRGDRVDFALDNVMHLNQMNVGG